MTSLGSMATTSRSARLVAAGTGADVEDPLRVAERRVESVLRCAGRDAGAACSPRRWCRSGRGCGEGSAEQETACVRIYISVDMEGASGVTRWQDVVTTGQDYQRARSWMTADVNAAVAGARAAGATEFVVEENHGVEMLCNLVLDELDPDVDVVRGLPRGGPTTAAALDDSFDAMFLVAHHAKVARLPGLLRAHDQLRRLRRRPSRRAHDQ